MGNGRENAPETQTKNKLTTKQGKQRQRHAFARESGSDSAIHSGSENKEEARGGRAVPPCWSSASLGPRASSSGGMQCQGSSLCTCQGYCTRLVRQKASAKENTSSWTLLERGGSKGHAQVLSCIKAGLWLCQNHNKCLLASVGRESPRLVLSRPHGRFIGVDPLSWSTVVRHPEQKMELNPTVLKLFHTGRSQRKRERRRHTDTHRRTHTHTRDLLLARQSQHLCPV